MTKNSSGFEVSLDDLKEAQTEEELNAIRKKLLKDWHPDFFTHSESVKKVAEKIAKDINEAYNAELLRICSGRHEQREKGNGKDVVPEKNLTVDLGRGVTLELASIPGGTFWMGTQDGQGGRDDERPHHQVTVTPFYMGIYPVTQTQWNRYMRGNPSRFKNTGRPVENVSWLDTQEFLQKLNATIETTSESFVKFGLPSEAEWEYACRAGTQTSYYFGDDPKELGKYAWFQDNSGKDKHETQLVGQKLPNVWGLYDMHGNVWEWCADTWHDNYIGAPKNGIVWDGGGYWDHLLRGGSYGSYKSECRSAARHRYYFDDERDNSDIGFRVMAVPLRTL